jgi:mannose-6-phosphate isomerase-like protein (cupin superfamily)
MGSNLGIRAARAGDDTSPTAKALFPGGVTVCLVTVYETETPDGLHGGSPHMHLTCTEGYVVLEGRGRLQTLTGEGFRELELEPLDVVWFEPGVIHRLVNDKALRLLVVMQNGGPEAGDAVFTFPPSVLADPAHYAAATAGGSETAVARRRDLAVEGFTALRADPAQLESFHAAALELVSDRLDEWKELWRAGALGATRRTGEILEELQTGSTQVLDQGRVHAGHAADEPQRLGMCGRLAVVDWSSVA